LDKAQTHSLWEIIITPLLPLSLNTITIPESRLFSGDKQRSSLSECNTTLAIDGHTSLFRRIWVESKHPEVKCHVVKYTVVPQEIVYSFFGVSHSILGSIEQRIREAGLWQMYEANNNELALVENSMLIRKRLQKADDERTVPFHMTDIKIFSIFVGWVSLMTGTWLVFLIESIFSCIAFDLKEIILIFQRRCTFTYISILKGYSTVSNLYYIINLLCICLKRS